MAEHLERLKWLKKEEKEMVKALETPEEKRLRRLAKKEAKEKKRKEQMGWDAEYSNRDNPFGDSNLEQTFVWQKKYQKEGKANVDEREIERLNKRNMEETKRELEQVKQRRIQREKEREARVEEMNKVQRDKEMATFKEWEKQEDTFHLKQAKLRSRIRLRDGRAKPIDILARYIDTFGENDPELAENRPEEEIEDEERFLMQPHIPEPYKCLNGLRKSDLEDLKEDIKVYMELDKNRNIQFWRDMELIVDDELAKLRNYKSSAATKSGERRREGINPAVASDVISMFEGKSPSELTALKLKIESKLSSGEEGVDVSYWETLLSKLKAFVARAKLRETHKDNMKIRMERLKMIKPKGDPRDDYEKRERSTRDSRRDNDDRRSHDQRSHRTTEWDDRKRRHEDEPSCSRDRQDSETEIKPEVEEPKAGSSSDAKPSDEQGAHDKPGTGGDEEQDAVDPEVERQLRIPFEIQLMQKCREEYDEGRYSPTLYSMNHVEVTTAPLVVDPEEDHRLLMQNRERIFKIYLGYKNVPPVIESLAPVASSSVAPSVSEGTSTSNLGSAEVAFEKEAKKGMGKDENQFSVEEKIIQGKNVTSWSEKYKPRKPRYFNRVHTGFEWNKYNQTHYDVDNPPPKIVQGYKFNLFYPDLIDKSSTPKYTITPCPDNRDFAIIRFSAGPPYEDIAFKIVNREWNYSYKSGFRSQFNNNILQLWFHFKRYRYRR